MGAGEPQRLPEILLPPPLVDELNLAREVWGRRDFALTPRAMVEVDKLLDIVCDYRRDVGLFELQFRDDWRTL